MLHGFSSPHLFFYFFTCIIHFTNTQYRRYTKYRSSPKRGLFGGRFSLTNFSIKRSSITGYTFGRKASSIGSKSSSVIVPFRENADNPLYNISSYNIQVFCPSGFEMGIYCSWAFLLPNSLLFFFFFISNFPSFEKAKVLRDQVVTYLQTVRQGQDKIFTRTREFSL